MRTRIPMRDIFSNKAASKPPAYILYFILLLGSMNCSHVLEQTSLPEEPPCPNLERGVFVA